MPHPDACYYCTASDETHVRPRERKGDKSATKQPGDTHGQMTQLALLAPRLRGKKDTWVPLARAIISFTNKQAHADILLSPPRLPSKAPAGGRGKRKTPAYSTNSCSSTTKRNTSRPLLDVFDEQLTDFCANLHFHSKHSVLQSDWL